MPQRLRSMNVLRKTKMPTLFVTSCDSVLGNIRGKMQGRTLHSCKSFFENVRGKRARPPSEKSSLSLTLLSKPYDD
jgi:hypothetical protein